jgi:hypothetical protein
VAVFSIPNYRRFVGGQSISRIGSWTETTLLLRECLRSYEELLPGRSLDVSIERIRPEHAGE